MLTAEQLGPLLQLNVHYVRKLTRQGVIPAHRLSGGCTFRYWKTEILVCLPGQPIASGR